MYLHEHVFSQEKQAQFGRCLASLVPSFVFVGLGPCILFPVVVLGICLLGFGLGLPFAFAGVAFGGVTFAGLEFVNLALHVFHPSECFFQLDCGVLVGFLRRGAWCLWFGGL